MNRKTLTFQIEAGDAGTRETAAGLLCALMEATHLIWS